MTPDLPPWLHRSWAQFRNALAEQRLGHAILLVGEAGLGKRALAATMQARLLCRAPQADDHACGQCPSCTWLAAGSHPDALHLQPEEDSKFIRIHQVRGLAQRMQLTSQAGPRRVAMIDPAEAMNAEAQNALLKTLEEPPAGVHLLLITDAPSRVLATVRSRCQTYTVIAPDSRTAAAWLGTDADLALALAAGHPGRAQAYAEHDRQRRAVAIADELQALVQGRVSPLAVATRWLDQPLQHIDDVIAWLRLWSWHGAGVTSAAALPPPAGSPLVINDRYREALRLRRRLQTPLKDLWLLHEWLRGWTRS